MHSNHGYTPGMHGPSRSKRVIGLTLTVTSMLAAMTVVLAQNLGWIETGTTKLLVIALGVLLFPIVCIDAVHGLMVYALVAPISPEIDLPGVAGSALNIRVQDLLVPMVLFSVVLREQRFGSPNVKTPLRRWLIMYGAFAILVTAVAPVSGALRYSAQWTYALKVVQFVLLAICVSMSLRSSRHVVMMMAAMVCGTILQFAMLQRPGSEEAFRLSGSNISEQPNVLGVYIVIATGVILGALDRSKIQGVSVVLGLMLVVAGFFVLETKSRTGFTSLAVMGVVALFVMRRKLIAGLMFVCGLVGLLLRPDLADRFGSLGVVLGISRDSSYESRLHAYGQIWEYITSTTMGTLFGGGRGSYPLAFADTQWGIELLYGGLVGFTVFVVFLIAVLWVAAKTWVQCRKRDDALGAAATGAFLGLCGAAMSTFGLTSWSAIRTGETIFLLIGIVMAVSRLCEIERREQRYQSVATRRKLSGGGLPAQPVLSDG